MKFRREISSFDTGFLTGVVGRATEAVETTGRATAEAVVPTAGAGLGEDPTGVPIDGRSPTGVPTVGLGAAVPNGVLIVGIFVAGAGVELRDDGVAFDVPIGVPIFGRPTGVPIVGLLTAAGVTGFDCCSSF